MWVWLASILFSSALAAQKVSYPPQDIVLKNVTQVRIVGVRGSLTLKENPASRFKDKLRLSVKHTKDRKSDDWYLSVERRGHTLFIEVFSTAYGKEWRKQVKQEKWPEFDLHLEGAARDTTISWREGDLKFIDWANDLDVSFLKGVVEFNGGKGQVKLQAVRADVKVDGQSGPLTIQGESGAVKMNAVTGNVKLNWLSGDLDFARCEGQFKIEGREAQLNVRASGGEWYIDLPKGNAEVQGFRGLLKATGGESKWMIEALGGADVTVSSEAGAVSVKRPPGQIKVFLTSLSGEIAAPPEFTAKTLDGSRIVEGVQNAEGKGTLGQLFVKTRSGAIRLY